EEDDLVGSYQSWISGDFLSTETINNRTRAWIPGINDLTAKGATLFVVGSGHLRGTQGLIELLTAEGYTCTPFPTTQPRYATDYPEIALRLLHEAQVNALAQQD
ncbi:MAG: TraB/GumN family protein, partial [Cytophagales bacterium]